MKKSMVFHLATLLWSYKYSLSEDTFNTGALFLQSDGYIDDSEQVQFRF